YPTTSTARTLPPPSKSVRGRYATGCATAASRGPSGSDADGSGPRMLCWTFSASGNGGPAMTTPNGTPGSLRPSDPQPAPFVLKPDAAARYLEVSARTLWALTKNGELACVRFGRAVRYRVQDLEELAARRTVRGPKAVPMRREADRAG